MLKVVDEATKESTSGKMINWYVLPYGGIEKRHGDLSADQYRDGTIMDW